MKPLTKSIQARINGNVIHIDYDENGNILGMMGWGE